MGEGARALVWLECQSPPGHPVGKAHWRSLWNTQLPAPSHRYPKVLSQPRALLPPSPQAQGLLGCSLSPQAPSSSGGARIPILSTRGLRWGLLPTPQPPCVTVGVTAAVGPQGAAPTRAHGCSQHSGLAHCKDLSREFWTETTGAGGVMGASARAIQSRPHPGLWQAAQWFTSVSATYPCETLGKLLRSLCLFPLLYNRRIPVSTS